MPGLKSRHQKCKASPKKAKKKVPPKKAKKKAPPKKAKPAPKKNIAAPPPPKKKPAAKLAAPNGKVQGTLALDMIDRTLRDLQEQTLEAQPDVSVDFELISIVGRQRGRGSRDREDAREDHHADGSYESLFHDAFL